MAPVRLLLAGLLILSMLVPPMSAHEPPRPRDFETRLLTDQNDDCGGPGDTGCNGSPDLLALSVREAYFPEDGHVLVFALWMAPGNGQEPIVRISMQGPDDRLGIEVTQQGDAFHAEPALRVEGPYPLLLNGERDGDRLGVDIVVGRDAFGLAAGDRLRAFRVEAWAGETTGDVMPGTYTTGEGMAPKGATEIAAPAETVRPDYTLQGPTRPLRMTTPEDTVSFTVSTAATFEVTVANVLGDMEQDLTLTEESPSGVAVRLDDGSVWSDRLGPKEERTVTAHVDAAEPGAHGITLRLTSDLGGLVEANVDLVAGPEEETRQGEEAPAPAASVWVVALALAAGVARRRTGA